MTNKKKRGLRIGLMLMALEAGFFLPGNANVFSWATLFPPATAQAAKQKADPHGYVEKTAVVQQKEKVDASKLHPLTEVLPADMEATPRTKALLQYLSGIQGSGKILYGHQNDMHRKVGKRLPTDSDTYDITGDYPAVVGMDGLALTGSELELTEAEKASGLTLPQKLARIALKADRQGAIVTLSCHMPNFAEVAKRPKVDGHYDYTGYSPNITGGNVVHRILPGGDLNEVYTGYLDLVAAFDSILQQADVPLIFRPFHESSGDWFWWGTKETSPMEFTQLFAYTESYLQGKGLHNMLYAFSPDGSRVKSEGDYSLTYPGNRCVDIMGIDMYHRNAEKGDDFLEGEFSKNLELVEKFAAVHHKVAAVTETGVLGTGCALPLRHNGYKSWFRDAAHVMAKHHMAYFMTWANFDIHNFDQPFMVDTHRGHEMVNDFVAFYNDPVVVFASQNAKDYSSK